MEARELSPHQTVLLSMLKDFDSVCRAHEIPYILFSGTALGAVRHRGFIPWDDDLDVMLLRADYKRFFDEAAGDLDPERYFVQREFGPHWPMQFSKLRLRGTTCMEKYHPKDPELHQGVYLDIFPCDNLASGWLTRKLQFFASRVVIAKALYQRGYETDSSIKMIVMWLCRLLPRDVFRRLVERRKEANSEMVHSFFACGTKYEKNVFPRCWMTERKAVSFEDGVFPVSDHVEEQLTKLYGDYMKIPSPEERRVKEHVALLDLEHSYRTHLDEQQAMRFDTLTRSIR